MEKALTARQFAVLAFMAAIAVKMFMLPSLLVATAGRNGYVYMLAYLAIDLAGLLLIAVAIRRADTDFYGLITRVLGKIGARVLLTVCTAFMVFKMTLMLGEIKVFFAESLFETFSWPVYLVPLIGLLWYTAVRSPRGIGRTAEIILPFIALSMVLLFVLSAARPEYENLLPFMREKAGPFAEYSLWLGDYSVLAVFIGKTETGKRAGGKALIAAGVGAIIVTAFTVILCAAFGNMPGLIEYGHNLGGLSGHSGAQNFGRIDLLVFSVWTSSVFIKLMLYAYAATRHALFVTNVKHPAAPYVAAGVLLLAVYALCVWAFPTQAAVYGAATGTVMRCFAIPEQALVPLVVCLGALLRRRREHVQG